MTRLLRTLWRTPGYSVTVVLVLAAGIGMAAAMFSVVRQVLLAPLPYPQPDRLVAIAFQYPGESPSTRQVGTALPFLRENSHSFQAVGFAGGGPTSVNLTTPDAASPHPVSVQQLSISHEFLRTLGIRPMLGRDFTAEEDTRGGPSAALLSYDSWQTQFGGDPRILGRLLRVNGADVPVVGVLPPHALADLTGPSREAGPTMVFQPLKLSATDPGYEGTNYQMIARLRDGVSVQSAQDELDALVPAFAQQNSWFNEWRMPNGLHNHFGVSPLQRALTGDVRGSLLVLMGAVLAVLLVACLNLAGLSSLRARRRTRELAVRSALGASRWALVRLLMAESVLLTLAGAGLGLIVAHFAQFSLLHFAPLALPQFRTASTTMPLVLAAAAFALISMILFSAGPVLGTLRSDVNGSLRRSASPSVTAGVSTSSAVLIVCQVSMALMLLCAAALLWGTLLQLRATPPGVEASHTLVAQVSLREQRYASTLHTTQFVDRVLSELGRQPGLQSEGAVNGLPFDRGLNISGWPVGDSEHHRVIEVRFATPGYLETMGIGLLRGRAFTAHDTATAPHVAIVSETAARRWWPDRSPLGERINIGNEAEYEVVGISRDTHESSLLDAPPILVYVPLTQITDRFTKMINNWFPTTIVAKSAAGVDLSAAMRTAVHAVDPDMPLSRLTTMRAVVEQTTEAPAFLSWLSGCFAAFTVLLSMLGLFGLLSYQVSERVREIAIRMALGATRGVVLISFLWRGLLLTGLGIAVGLGGGVLLPRLLAPVLQAYVLQGSPVPPADVLHQANAMALATSLLALAAMAACALPVYRASQTEPAAVLRSE